jgi:hypothetical protein
MAILLGIYWRILTACCHYSYFHQLVPTALISETTAPVLKWLELSPK